MGYENWYLLDDGSGLDDGGGNDVSSARRVSRHQNLYDSVKWRDWQAKTNIPERCLAISDVLALPLDDIEDVQDAVIVPIFVEDAV